MSQQSFADLGVSAAVSAALEADGFAAPFAIQTQVIGDVLAGRDVLAKSPTGSGKTLAFMVPLVDRIAAEARRPAALVLTPTRELATQIVESTYRLAHSRALRIRAVYGGVGLERQGREAAAAHVIVATPGRLEDHLARGTFSLDHVSMLVLDEADRMLDMGFRPAVDRIVSRCPAVRQTLFFSATLDGEAGRIAERYTRDAQRHVYAPPARRQPAIEHRFVRVERDDRVGRLVSEIGAGAERTIVFVRTKHGADRLVRRLARHDVAAVAMHGDKSQGQRERALAAFENGTTTTLVATDVAARGIHVDAVAAVVNFDPPTQAEDYVHRVGRTGRAGERGVAITLFGEEHLEQLRPLVRTLGLERPWEQETGERLEAPAAPAAGGGGGGGRKRSRRAPGGQSTNGAAATGRGQGSEAGATPATGGSGRKRPAQSGGRRGGPRSQNGNTAAPAGGTNAGSSAPGGRPASGRRRRGEGRSGGPGPR